MATVDISSASLCRALMSVCASIDAEMDGRASKTLTETELRTELVSCLLGSQVRAEAANAAVARLKRAGLLASKRWKELDVQFESDVKAVLEGKLMRRSPVSYRFPALRARQLSAMRAKLEEYPLKAYIGAATDARSIRSALVADIPGIGPKQASMFIRNIGRSFDLAILDVHVLRFLQAVGALPDGKQNVSTITAYERIERSAKNFADALGRSVGYLDWAIWITMRAATEVSS